MTIRPILGDDFAPITSAAGFIRLPLEEAAEAVAAWWRSLAPPVAVDVVDRPFPMSLCALLPLEVGRRSRALLVRQTNGWTAYFDCLATGTDPVSAMIAIARTSQCDAVAIRSEPTTPRRFGSVQFEIYGAKPTHFLNIVRSVAVYQDTAGWEFSASGEVQPFERTEAYVSRDRRHRFTSDLLNEYCNALGFAPFDERAYRDSALVSATAPPDSDIVSLREAKELHGIGGGVDPCGEPVPDQLRVKRRRGAPGPHRPGDTRPGRPVAPP